MISRDWVAEVAMEFTGVMLYSRLIGRGVRKAGPVPADEEFQPIATRSIERFHADIADHSVFLGGGSVASVSGAAAASLIVLVLELSARRRSNADAHETLEAAINEVATIQRRLYAAADDDARVLDQLLLAQRSARTGDEGNLYRAALLDAARSPLETATDCQRLLEIIAATMDRATRFTVSDLGAAAHFALAGVQAAAMMCDVNIALLQAEPESSTADVEDLAAKSAQLVAAASTMAADIDNRTRLRIQAST